MLSDRRGDGIGKEPKKGARSRQSEEEDLRARSRLTRSRCQFSEAVNIVTGIACEKMPTTGLLLGFTRRKHAQGANAMIKCTQWFRCHRTKQGANTNKTEKETRYRGDHYRGSL